jgi:hypothetical protein
MAGEDRRDLLSILLTGQANPQKITNLHGQRSDIGAE